MNRFRASGKRFAIFGGIPLTAAAFAVVALAPTDSAPLASAFAVAEPFAAASGGGPAAGMSTAEYAASDPLGFARWARQQFEQSVSDYRCTFSKQEMVNGSLNELQKIELRYRKKPESIFLIWKENADEAKRALFIPDDPRFREKDGSRLAKVEPAGAIARLLVSDIMIEIDGSRAKKASRRTIADCGFAGTYRLLEEYNGAAERNGDLDFRYIGPATVAGRSTYRFERFVPEHKVDGVKYVDARMILHIDQQLFVPVAVYSFADHAGKKLLGQYLFSDINVKPNFTARDFEF